MPEGDSPQCAGELPKHVSAERKPVADATGFVVSVSWCVRRKEDALMRGTIGAPRRHRGICKLCGADIYIPSRIRHEASFRCYARRGGLIRDGWVRPARCGGVSSAVYSVWPAAHSRRWPDFVGRSDGLHFTGHRRMYLRSPRPEIHIEVLLKAMAAYRARHRVGYVDVLRDLMSLPVGELRRLALTWSPPVRNPPAWQQTPEPSDHWILTFYLLRWDSDASS